MHMFLKCYICWWNTENRNEESIFHTHACTHNFKLKKKVKKTTLCWEKKITQGKFFTKTSVSVSPTHLSDPMVKTPVSSWSWQHSSARLKRWEMFDEDVSEPEPRLLGLPGPAQVPIPQLPHTLLLTLCIRNLCLFHVMKSYGIVISNTVIFHTLLIIKILCGWLQVIPSISLWNNGWTHTHTHTLLRRHK